MAIYCPKVSHAQSIQINFDQTPLPQVLTELGVQLGLDFIYSVRLIENQRVSCTYAGEQIDLVLSCIFDDTPIKVQQVHQRQYILSSRNHVEATQVQESVVPSYFSIKGYVLDKSTGKPLPGAHIYFPEQRQGMVSDTEGLFLI